MKIQDTFIHFTQPLFGNEEKLEIINALDSGWVTLGPRTKQFEEDFARYVGAKYAVGVTSNTVGMFLSLVVAGIQPGDEVITSPFTFVATLNTIEQARAIPILVDIEPKTFNIDTNKIEERITSKTKAIMPVHYGGLSVDMDKILEIAKKYNLKVIEDAAHASGASYKGKKIGTHGDLAIFSFHPVKNMSTGDGGMITTDNEEYATKLSQLRLHGMTRDAWKRHSATGSWKYDVEMPGYKYNMTDISAALGIHQLKKLDSFIDIRKKYADLYDRAFSSIPEITIPYIPQNEEHIYSLYTIKINTKNLTISRDEIVERLKQANIGVSVYFIPAHYFTYYKNKYNYKEGDFPVAEDTFEQIISLPIYPKISEAHIEYIIETLKSIIEENRCIYNWKLDDFDTEIFGMRTAKIKELEWQEDQDRLHKTIEALQEDLKANNIGYSVFRTSSNNYPLMQALESHGFVMVDGLVSLVAEVEDNKFAPSTNIRPAKQSDLDDLKILAFESFDKTRVFNDSLLDKKSAGKLYVRWIENSLNGKAADQVLVWDESGKILGFVTLQKSGHIPLVAVDKTARGKGIAKNLVKAALKSFSDWGIAHSEIETQVANIPALRAYQACGFKITDSFVTFRWATNITK